MPMRPPTPGDLARLEVAHALDRLIVVERGNDIPWARAMENLADLMRRGAGVTPIYDERPPAPVLRLISGGAP